MLHLDPHRKSVARGSSRTQSAQRATKPPLISLLLTHPSVIPIFPGSALLEAEPQLPTFHEAPLRYQRTSFARQHLQRGDGVPSCGARGESKNRGTHQKQPLESSERWVFNRKGTSNLQESLPLKKLSKPNGKGIASRGSQTARLGRPGAEGPAASLGYDFLSPRCPPIPLPRMGVNGGSFMIPPINRGKWSSFVGTWCFLLASLRATDRGPPFLKQDARKKDS